MRALAPLLLLAACAAEPDAPADEPDPPATVKPDPEPPVDTDRPDTDLPDPCLSEPSVLTLGRTAYGQNWTDDDFVPFEPGARFVMERLAGSGKVRNPALSLHVTNSPQLLRLSANLTDLATGAPLLLGREPSRINLGLFPVVLGKPWSCDGGWPEWHLSLDPRGLDDDESVPVWQELCGRAVRLDVSLRDINTDPVAMATVELVLAPSPYDAPTCP